MLGGKEVIRFRDGLKCSDEIREHSTDCKGNVNMAYREAYTDSNNELITW